MITFQCVSVRWIRELVLANCNAIRSLTNTQGRGQRGLGINTRECQTKENIIKIMIRDRAKPRVAGYNQREKRKIKENLKK